MSNLNAWTRRSPFAEFDALVKSAFGPVEHWPEAAAFSPAAEIARDGDDALVRLDLPGVDVENDATVEVQNGQLVVRGERKSQAHEGSEGLAVREVRYGSFRRAFKLPAQVAPEAVSANYDAGVLTVRVAGVHKSAEPQRISVTLGGTPAPVVDEAAAEAE